MELTKDLSLALTCAGQRDDLTPLIGSQFFSSRHRDVVVY